jgi:D-alanyl-D-alanine carboxypeptidase
MIIIKYNKYFKYLLYLNLQYVNFRFFKPLFLTVCVLLFFLLSCVTKKISVIDEPVQDNIEQEYIEDKKENDVIQTEDKNDAFMLDLLTILKGDPYLWLLVDKNNPLGDYVPNDLVVLYSVNYDNVYGVRLRAAAAASLEEMAAAARKRRLKLTVASAYRSLSYQANLYAFYVNTLGIEEADKISVRPGYSQHQLGLAVDFSPVSNAFAKSAENNWIKANASKFGWSLSYPEGYEDVTGYSWESWHYRYVGRELAEFIDKYFDGVQQHALEFIYEWERNRAF